MKQALTKLTLKAAMAAGVPEGKERLVVWDARPTGLGLRLRASGGASWIFVYRPKGSPKGTTAKTVTLGAYPTMDLDEARKSALALASRAVLGGDPAEDRRQQRIRERSRLSGALDGYELDLKRRKVVALDEKISILRRGLEPMLGQDIGDIDQPMLIGRIREIATKPRRRKDGSTYATPGAAIEFRKHAHAFLAWCVSSGLAKSNALAGYRMPRMTREELLAGANGREGKALSDEEIGKLWMAAGEAGAFGGLVRLGLLSGLRRNEIAELEWQDVQADAIHVPAHRSKMGREHFVPLTALTRGVIAAQPRNSNQLVFASPVSNDVMAGWSKLRPRLVKTSGVDFRIHDLRRTCRTLMSRLNVDEATAELAIGHVRRGLVGLYNRDVAWAGRIAAFESVSRHIEKLISEDGSEIPANVVALRRS